MSDDRTLKERSLRGMAEGRRYFRKASKDKTYSSDSEKARLQRLLYKRYLTTAGNATEAVDLGVREFESRFNNALSLQNGDLDDSLKEQYALSQVENEINNYNLRDSSYYTKRLVLDRQTLVKKYRKSGLKKGEAQKKADEEFAKELNSYRQKIASLDPTLSKNEIEELANRALGENLSTRNLLGILSDSNLKNKATNIIKKQVRQRASMILIGIPIIGWAFYIMINYRWSRLPIILVTCALCMCIFSVISQVLDITTGEFKATVITESPQLVTCGVPGVTNTNEEALTCLFEKKTEEYTQSVNPREV